MAHHTDIPTHADVMTLIALRRPACVTIYLPTSTIAGPGSGDRIELKNLVAEAVARLDEGGVPRREVSVLREGLGDVAEDDAFWERQANSLAVFATPEWVHTFRLPSRLSATAQVGDRFHVKPLLRAVTFPQAAYVLALSQGAVRLIEIASDVEPVELRVEGLPSDIASFAGKASITDRSPARRIQGTEGQKLRMVQYARQIDEAIRAVLAGGDLPLILAATEPLDAIFRSVCTYPNLAPGGLTGNPDRTPNAELAQGARAILDQVYAAELTQVRALFATRLAQDRATTDLGRVARAATYGAVDTILVDIDRVVPGTVDEHDGTLNLSAAVADADSYGVVDEIARRVLLTGGRVLAVRADDVPDGACAAAILRYAL